MEEKKEKKGCCYSMSWRAAPLLAGRITDMHRLAVSALFLARGRTAICVVSSRRRCQGRDIALAYKTPAPAIISLFAVIAVQQVPPRSCSPTAPTRAASLRWMARALSSSSLTTRAPPPLSLPWPVLTGEPFAQPSSVLSSPCCPNASKLDG